MNLISQEAYKSLYENIDSIISVYRRLLDIVRSEKEILISAQLDELNESNKAKEAMLKKVRHLEEQRQALVFQIVEAEGLDNKNPKLLDLVNHFQDEKLRNYHSVLVLLLKSHLS